MSRAYVSELAKKHNITIEAAEKHWRTAKKKAAGEGHSDDYAYVTGIFKKMMRESAPTPKSQFTKAELDDEAKMVDDEANKKIRKAKTVVKTAGDKIAITKMKIEKGASASIRATIKGLDESVMVKANGVVMKAVSIVHEAKVQQVLEECKASSFKEFLINEAETEDESLEDILKKGKSNYNSWYTGFYHGYHGNPHQESKAVKHYKAGYKEGESAKSDDEPFSK
jgi:hypothetical protein